LPLRFLILFHRKYAWSLNYRYNNYNLNHESKTIKSKSSSLTEATTEGMHTESTACRSGPAPLVHSLLQIEVTVSRTAAVIIIKLLYSIMSWDYRVEFVWVYSACQGVVVEPSHRERGNVAGGEDSRREKPLPFLQQRILQHIQVSV
jgi:hypothetical protein